MSYHTGMQLNFFMQGKKRTIGLSLRTEPYYKKTLRSTGSQKGKFKHESNQVLKQKYLRSSKAHISLNDTKQAVNIYSIANMCNFSTGPQA